MEPGGPRRGSRATPAYPRAYDRAVLVALAVLAVVTLLARRTVASPALARLRALFPAWRFFDRAVESPRLWLRVDGGAWHALEAPPRSWLVGWAFAPASNLALAYHAVIEQLVAELGELALEDATDDPVVTEPEVVGLVSYELVTRIARAHVPAGARFAWKIVVPGPIDYLQSPELT